MRLQFLPLPAVRPTLGAVAFGLMTSWFAGCGGSGGSTAPDAPPLALIQEETHSSAKPIKVKKP